MTTRRRCSRARPARTSSSGNSRPNSLPRQLVVAEHEIFSRRQWLVALEARRELRVRVRLLRRRESLILPLAVADLLVVLGAPAFALLHHGIGEQVRLDETAV